MLLKLVPTSTNINFLGLRFFCIGLSGLIFALTLGLLFSKGLNYGIDFAGGTLVQLQTEKAVPTADIRAQMERAGYDGLIIQEYGAPTEILIRVPNQAMPEGGGEATTKAANEMAGALASIAGKTDVRRVEFVGPQIGEELKQKGLLAILFSTIAILIYVSVRFEFRFAVGALVALLHDVMITVGVFSLIQKEISLPVLAAFLTILGYSLNDTIVVFDRVRENMRRYKKKSFLDVLNISVNEMLNRTLMMTLTTAAVLLSLLFFGGEVIHNFAFALLVGVVVGTYSSIYIAAPIVLWMESKKDYLETEQET